MASCCPLCPGHFTPDGHLAPSLASFRAPHRRPPPPHLLPSTIPLHDFSFSYMLFSLRSGVQCPPGGGCRSNALPCPSPSDITWHMARAQEVVRGTVQPPVLWSTRRLFQLGVPRQQSLKGRLQFESLREDCDLGAV